MFAERISAVKTAERLECSAEIRVDFVKNFLSTSASKAVFPSPARTSAPPAANRDPLLGLFEGAGSRPNVPGVSRLCGKMDGAVIPPIELAKKWL